MNNVVWSNGQTRDKLKSLGDEEKFNALVDRGYDPEMLGSANLDDIIDKDNLTYNDDTRNFDDSILPMLNGQTLNGILIVDGRAIPAEMLGQGQSTIEDDGQGLSWNGKPIYTIPENDAYGFVSNCMHDAMDAEYDMYGNEEDAINRVYDALNDTDYINQYLDTNIVANFCGQARNTFTESLKESKQLNEVRIKDDYKPQLLKELEEIKPLADEYGYEYFTAMPFTAYEDDPESIEHQYPLFFKVCKAFFKEMGIAENPDDTDELDELWYLNVDQRDWDTIVKTCDIMLNDEKGRAQIDKIYAHTGTNPEPTEEPTEVEPNAPLIDYDESLNKSEPNPEDEGQAYINDLINQKLMAKKKNKIHEEDENKDEFYKGALIEVSGNGYKIKDADGKVVKSGTGSLKDAKAEVNKMVDEILTTSSMHESLLKESRADRDFAKRKAVLSDYRRLSCNEDLITEENLNDWALGWVCSNHCMSKDKVKEMLLRGED